MHATQRQGAAIERRIISREHRDLEHVVARIESTAELAGNLAARDLATALRILLDDIEKHFLPHLEWEETWYFAEVDKIAGTPWATKLLRFEHRQFRVLVERLEADWLALRHEPSHRQLVDLRARLYGLHAITTTHFQQEEQYLMPVLDMVTGEEAAVLEGE
jgi:iron-sulfur cluster repair protein YtfE (RIC family)